MTPDELSRYSRQIILPGIGVEGQNRLREARVLVVGMGGLGSPAALYLAAGGIGTLGLADFDTVAGHNLQRQILHDEAWTGQPKLESAVARLRALNPAVHLEPHPAGVTVENARQLFASYDVIVDGTDNFPTRYLNNDAAFFAEKPLIYGSVFQFEGQVSVFAPSMGGPCYRCLFPAMPQPGTVPNCEEAGVLGALCGVVGSWQAMEVIKLLTGVGAPLLGRLQIIDARAGNVRSIRLKPDAECPLCGSAPTIRELKKEAYEWKCAPNASPSSTMAESESISGKPLVTVAEAAAEMADGAILLDVREAYERAIVQIEGSLNIPLRQLPMQAEALDKDARILCLCHHGGRSQRVADYLTASGFRNVANVQGGINQWAIELDPTMRRY